MQNDHPFQIQAWPDGEPHVMLGCAMTDVIHSLPVIQPFLYFFLWAFTFDWRIAVIEPWSIDQYHRPSFGAVRGILDFIWLDILGTSM